MSPRPTRTSRAALTLLTSAAVAMTGLPTAASVAAGESVRPFDLNGDGRAEIVTGMPSYDVPAAGHQGTAAGAVLVLWGGRDRRDETLLTQAGAEVPGEPELDDRFGHAVASADFDRDGYADLAIGAPGDKLPGTDFGTVTVVYGSKAGIGMVEQLHTGQAGLGSALVAADFVADGWPDLAVGAAADRPREDQDYGSGSVVFLTGGPDGLTVKKASVIQRPDDAMASFGAVLAAGDVNRDGHLDLVEGYAGVQRWIDDPPVPGHVTFTLGSATGPTTAVQLSSRSASALAVGDVTGDGGAEIFVGSALRKPYTEDDPTPRGRVTWYRGTDAGPATTGTTVTQATPGVPGRDEPGDHFGAALALSDIDQDGRPDLLVGAPGEDGNRGRVTILHTTKNGIGKRHHVTLDQASPAVPGSRERHDRFGADLTAFDFSNDGRGDLVIGSPGEDRNAGSLTAIQLAGIFYRARGVDRHTLESLDRPGGGRAPELGAVL